MPTLEGVEEVGQEWPSSLSIKETLPPVLLYPVLFSHITAARFSWLRQIIIIVISSLQKS
jgi:hypothetical protein